MYYAVRVYKYDSSQEANGYRGAGDSDFSKFVQIGNQNKEDITQELDTGEITLSGMPFREEICPETKLIIDTVEIDGNIETVVETLHRVVQKDMVNQPILTDDTYFDHHITLIEPSVVAQKRLVDNIAATYKLKDVNLIEVPAFSQSTIYTNIQTSQFTPERNFGVEREIIKDDWTGDAWYDHQVIGKYFQLEGTVTALNQNGESFDDIYSDIENFKTESGEYIASFTIPKLAIMYGDYGNKTFSNIGYASLSCKLEEFNLNDELNPTNSWSKTIVSNSNLGTGVTNNLNGFSDRYNGEWLLEQTESVSNTGTTVQSLRKYYKKYTDTATSDPVYLFENIQIQPNKRYVLTISLYQFPDDLPEATDLRRKFTGAQPTYYLYNRTYYQSVVGSGAVYIYLTEVPVQQLAFISQQTSCEAFMITYDINATTIVYASSMPYSALALLQKAIINSSIYEKKNGVYIADINNSNLPFYIDTDFIDELGATLIIENFYNQKNLWEIMIEIGNYIHAIPELRFGSNDKFVITFNRLGRTDQQSKESQSVSIYNSRGVEDYISATSSYIENMVQLGGYIEEWVAPKTTDETYLVSNDTAEIIVSKPIIELLSITVKRNSDGLTADLTQYIYEENVYKTLGLNYDAIPNKGIAMYYSLGDNVIKGGQFQLPQANTNIYGDYSFKKIIYSAFNGYPVVTSAPTTGYWTTLRVSDYSFLVRYRTKDSVRQNHLRPDLRKYLLNSKFDRYPEQNQFNNQTDVVVDSIKFGNNVYGKLIKTGNSSFVVTEWNDRYSNLKHKGELYNLYGDLYYVAKVTHYNFGSYFLSEVTYSKDYNELSQIIGIPSEPRFYEISEQSLIWREFAINDLLLLTDNANQLEYQSNYVFNYDHLADLVLGEGTDFARYAVTVYKGDKDQNTYDQTIGEANLYIEVINPINAYSSENTLTYEYDMIDNYSAGDKVVNVEENEDIDPDLRAYTSLSAVKYTDIYGKAALMDFYILGDIENTENPLTVDDIKAFPESPISTKQGEERPFIGNFDILATNVKALDTNYNGRGIGLLKDCREALSINYNLQLITNSDTFVLSPYFFLPQKENVRVVLLADEVNKLSTGYINNSIIITPTDTNGQQMSTPYFDVPVTKTSVANTWDNTKTVVNQFSVDLSSIFANVNDGHFAESATLQRVKGIAILCDVSLDAGADTIAPTIPYKTQFIIARNIPANWTRQQALATWYFGAPKKDEVFKNKQ